MALRIRPSTDPHRDAVLHVLRLIGPSTDERLCNHYGVMGGHHGLPKLAMAEVRGRRQELERTGLVTDTGERDTLPNGKPSIRWRAR